MFKRIKKRDGRTVKFDVRKITEAIKKAGLATGEFSEKEADKLTLKVLNLAQNAITAKTPTVEQIQDIVEEVLLSSPYRKTVRAYIIYREQHARIREISAKANVDLMDQYLDKLDWQVNENSNMAFSLQGLNNYISSEVSKVYWLNKIYPPEVREAHLNGDFHIHDLGLLANYTYYGKEVVVVKIDGLLKLVSFEKLYGLVESKEKFLNEQEQVFAKYPEKDIYVLDKNGWTKIKRLVKKKKNRKMQFIKNRGGRSAIITDNHPMIIEKGEKIAADVETEKDKLFTVDLNKLLDKEEIFYVKEIDLLKEIRENKWKGTQVYFNGVPVEKVSAIEKGKGFLHTLKFIIPREIKLSKKFGYFVGFTLAEGYLSYDEKTPRIISLGQKDKKLLLKANQGLLENGMSGCLIKRKRGYVLEIKNPFLKFLFQEVFRIDTGSKNKTLPIDILLYNKDFVKGLLAGLIDGDGSLASSGTTISLRISARAMLEQCYVLLSLLGFTPRDRDIEGQGSIRFYKGRKIIQNYSLYGMSFRKIKGLNLPSEVYNKARFSKKAWQDETRDTWHKVLNNKIVKIQDRFIYDITTESKTLVVNGMWNHNCVGWDLEDLLIQGFKGALGKMQSQPAKHFRSALGQVVNFLYTLQGEAAGAVAFSNFDTLLSPFIHYDKLSYPEVKQAMQEFIFNMNVPTRTGFQSLTWSELVVIKENGKIKIEEIGRLIDEQFKKYPSQVIIQEKSSFAVKNFADIKTLSFNKEGKSIWADIKAWVKHKVPKNSKFVKIETSRGSASVSKAHSMFAFEKINKHFCPKPTAASQIKPSHWNSSLNGGNHIIALKELSNEGNQDKIDIVDLIKNSPYEFQRKVFVSFKNKKEIDLIKKNVEEKYGRFTPFYLEHGLGDTFFRDCRESKSMRYDVWKKFGESNENIQFFLKNSNVLFERYIRGERLKNFVKLCAWYITEGHNDASTGMFISQDIKGHKQILQILKALKIPYTIEKNFGYSSKYKKKTETQVLKIKANGLLAWLVSFLCGTYSQNKEIPYFIYNLKPEYQKLFIAELLKGDGYKTGNYQELTTTSRKLSLGLSLLLSMDKIEYSVYEVSFENKRWSRQYTIRIYKSESRKYAVGDFEARIVSKIEPFTYDKEFEYDISVNSELENFAGGSGLLMFHNTPFSNITLDLNIPSIYAERAVIIGGKPQEKAYKEFQKELDMFNRAFLEIMLEGDAKGRVFSFPIPTYNISRDFDWDNPKLKLLWEVTGKYGLPYFANFINSDMKPEDARSMCLFSDESLFIKEGQRIKKMAIEEAFERYKGRKIDSEWYQCDNNIEVISLNPKTGKLEWTGVKRFLKVSEDDLINIKTKDGKVMKVSKNHLVAIFDEDGINFKKAYEVNPDDFLLVLKNGRGVLNENDLEGIDVDLAWFMGLFIADGNYLYNSRYKDEKRIAGIQISFNSQEKKLIEKTREVIKKLVDYNMKFVKDPRYEKSLRGYIYNKEFADDLFYKKDLHKYNKLPEWIWSAKPQIIEAFLKGLFDGDGYKRGKEFHISDKSLAGEINLLLQLVGISTTYRTRENSQVIRIQHTSRRGAKGNTVVKDKLHNLIPEFLLEKKFVRDKNILYQSYQNRMVGLSTIERWKLSNPKIEWLRNSDFAVVEVEEIYSKKLDYKQAFYDLELKKNRYFVHSNGNITHNCCRLRIDNRKLYKRGGGLFGSSPLTGSIGVVTINMPRLGYFSKTKKEFLQRLERLMLLAKNSLEIKRKILEKLTDGGLYPYAKFYLRNIKERFGQYWKNHFSTIGLVGMNEGCLNFLAKDIGTREGRKFAVEVLSFMRNKLLEFQKETGDNYNLEATPAEGVSYRLPKIDKKKYPQIICANEEEYKKGAKPFYTNSSQLSVNYTDDVFEALDLQDDIQILYTGGTVIHLFAGEQIKNFQAVKALVRKICENYHLPYFTLTPTFSICPTHGYIPGEHSKCPKCNAECEVYSRVVGYLRPIKQWNEGKREEFKQRKTFKINK